MPPGTAHPNGDEDADEAGGGGTARGAVPDARGAAGPYVCGAGAGPYPEPGAEGSPGTGPYLGDASWGGTDEPWTGEAPGP